MAVDSDYVVNQLSSAGGLLGAGDGPLTGEGTSGLLGPWAQCGLSGTPGELMKTNTAHWCELTADIRKSSSRWPQGLTL